MPQEVDRKIHFYRIDAGQNASGHLLPFDPAPTINHIRSLPTNGDRRLVRADGNSTYCWIFRGTAPQRLRVATVRRFGLPMIEAQGNVQSIALAADAGLADMTHVVLFPNNIAGADFNFYGPRLSRLEEYFAVKADGVTPPLTFDTLLNPNVAQRLNDLGELRLFNFRIRRSDVEVLEQRHQSIFRAFRALREVGTAEELEVILRPRKNGRNPIGEEPLLLARELANDDESRNSATKFVVKGVDTDGNVTEVDVIGDQLLAVKKVIKLGDQDRTIVPGSAFGAIEEAYDEMRYDIERAAAVHL